MAVRVIAITLHYTSIFSLLLVASLTLISEKPFVLNKDLVYGSITFTPKAEMGSDDGSAEQIQLPHGIAVDNSGNMYISESRNFMQKFDSNGTLITKWGSKGNADGEFEHPEGIELDHSSLYVSDTDNNRIQRFEIESKSGQQIPGE